MKAYTATAFRYERPAVPDTGGMKEMLEALAAEAIARYSVKEAKDRRYEEEEPSPYVNTGYHTHACRGYELLAAEYITERIGPEWQKDFTILVERTRK